MLLQDHNLLEQEVNEDIKALLYGDEDADQRTLDRRFAYRGIYVWMIIGAMRYVMGAFAVATMLLIAWIDPNPATQRGTGLVLLILFLLFGCSAAWCGYTYRTKRDELAVPMRYTVKLFDDELAQAVPKGQTKQDVVSNVRRYMARNGVRQQEWGWEYEPDGLLFGFIYDEHAMLMRMKF